MHGAVISTLCRFYTASGDRIKVHFDYSWRSHFFKDAPATTVENGQWTAFLHVHPSGSAKGNCGAVAASGLPHFRGRGYLHWMAEPLEHGI
ncbi:hypothetical protein JVT61DRAFT_11877 [Boletus reticuloceps]|uniref:Uncharacterized protein n=1 Tax=Boletus reticuloceps TaxID=495285 RepID=A0A8I2YWN7_9AGAM|nr:hypothetical protein JVT61DRAFT_11877 [Boletus reticuloceps]